MDSLPASPTRLIGREHDAAAACSLLTRPEVRLLTFLGSAGIGKTRLAIEVASRAASDFTDGVFFVDLSPVGDPERLLNVIAGALDIEEGPAGSLDAQLKRFLSQRQVLLVLDNFEQIVTSAGAVADLLVATSRLKIIVTSRIPLPVSWERRFPVPPLGLADADADMETLAQSAAASLFSERARALLPDFCLTGANGPAIAEICRRLDGVPLAIELAAARVDVQSPQGILDGLTSAGLDLLSGGALDIPERHRTLRAAIGWSARLLSEDEREVFYRLAVFSGGCTLAAAEAVCGSDRPGVNIGAVLASLVRKNLLRFEPEAGESGRYRMLEMVREYVLERLETLGQEAGLREQFLDWCLTLAEQAEAYIHDRDQKYWLDLLEEEHDNLRSALSWCQRTHRTEAGLRSVAALGWFWQVHGHLAEGSRWCEIFLKMDAAPQAPSRAYMNALIQAAWLANHTVQTDLLNECATEALSIALALEDRVAESWCLQLLARAFLVRRDFDKARELAEAGLAAAEASGNAVALRQGLFIKAHTLRLQGASDEAVALYGRVEALDRASGDLYQLMWTLVNVGVSARQNDQYKAAGTMLREALELARDLPSRTTINNCIWLLGHLAGLTSHPERAARLHGAAEALAERTGGGYGSGFNYSDRRLTSVRTLLGEETFAALDAEGHAWSQDEAIAYALAPDEPQPRTTASLIDALTPREAEVAALVAEGLTNRQIADQLVIAIQTADRHVSNILGKLGLSSRSQVAVWFVEHQDKSPTK